MNRYTLIFIFLLSLVSFPSLGVDFEDLVERDGLYYEKFSNVPYTGKVSGMQQGSLKEGKQWDGEYLWYHDNGQLRMRINYKNGKHHGEWSSYDRNGQLLSKSNRKNGKEHGEWTYYDKDGNLRSITQFKNGKREGKAIYYYPNGNVESTGTHKNGWHEGEWVYYHENGEVRSKSIYKNEKRLATNHSPKTSLPTPLCLNQAT